MADFTVKNLMTDVDNSAADRGPDGLEARFGRRHMDSEHLGVSYFRYNPNFRTPFGHHHREQEEAYVVVSGSGWARLDDEVAALRRWDVLRVAAAVVRSFEGGPDGLELLAFGSDRPEGGDALLARGWWPRAASQPAP
jgi:mannose-6-phosphate isomerase-like protein (cupin superfamily)